MEVRRGASPGTLIISMTGIVGERLDVEALICDWRAYLADCEQEAVLRRVCEELRRVAALPFSAFAGDVDVSTDALPNDPGGWARAGLLFGYPPVSTAAIVGTGLGLDGFAELDVDPEELPFKLHVPGWMAPAFTGTSEQASALAAAYRRTATARPGANPMRSVRPPPRATLNLRRHLPPDVRTPVSWSISSICTPAITASAKCRARRRVSVRAPPPRSASRIAGSSSSPCTAIPSTGPRTHPSPPGQCLLHRGDRFGLPLADLIAVDHSHPQAAPTSWPGRSRSEPPCGA